jgi:HPt (histidine-containing phosphotransfer) domain-containing protein
MQGLIGESQVHSTSGGDEQKPFCPDELLYRCLGNAEFARRIIDRFLDRLKTEGPDLEAAWKRQDLERFVQLAHRLKGSAASVAAQRIAHVLSELERMGREQRTHEAAAELTKLPEEIEAFKKIAANWRRTSQ